MLLKRLIPQSNGSLNVEGLANQNSSLIKIDKEFSLIEVYLYKFLTSGKIIKKPPKGGFLFDKMMCEQLPTYASFAFNSSLTCPGLAFPFEAFIT